MVTNYTRRQSSVTVVIPCYNAGCYLARTIESVLRQTCPVEEIIIVDDGSTDDTADVIKQYGKKVLYVSQKNNGTAAARNTGIELAHGQWIAFLDADDE